MSEKPRYVLVYDDLINRRVGGDATISDGWKAIILGAPTPDTEHGETLEEAPHGTELVNTRLAEEDIPVLDTLEVLETGDQQLTLADRVRKAYAGSAYTPLFASTKDEAMQILRRYYAQGLLGVVLQDIQLDDMPNKNMAGFDVAREFLREFPHIQFIMFTNFSGPDNRIEATKLKKHIHGFVPKDIDFGPRTLNYTRNAYSVFDEMQGEEHLEIKAGLKLASIIQRALLPKKDMPIHLAHHWLYDPASELGGDMIRLKAEPDGTFSGAIIDGMGHGIPAAFYAIATAIYMGRYNLPHDQAQLLRMLNEDLVANIPFSEVGHDATVLSWNYNPTNGLVEIANAGHEPALVYRSRAGSVELIEIYSLRIGSTEPGDSVKFEPSSATIKLAHGDIFLAYSDGLTDAFDHEKNPFTLERVKEILRAQGRQGVSVVFDSILKELGKHRADAERKNDDLIFYSLQMP